MKFPVVRIKYWNVVKYRLMLHMRVCLSTDGRDDLIIEHYADLRSQHKIEEIMRRYIRANRVTLPAHPVPTLRLPEAVQSARMGWLTV